MSIPYFFILLKPKMLDFLEYLELLEFLEL
jgi:hypothetical protein